MRAPLLDARGLTRRFRQGPRDVTVLAGVDLRVDAGEVVMVVGRSGSGKSTLLNLLGGLDVPDAGSIRLGLPDGVVDLAVAAEAKRTTIRRRHMGFVFQFLNLVPTLTARENVALPLELNGVRGSERRAAEGLRGLGLAERADAYPEELSGGEQQRVAIARALAHEPALLLADEPTGNLDRETGDAVFARLLASVREARAALVMVTHDRELAAAGDRVLELGVKRESAGA